MTRGINRLGPRATGWLLLVLLVARGPLCQGVPPSESAYVAARVASHLEEGRGARFNPSYDAPQIPRPVESPLALALVYVAATFGFDPLDAQTFLPRLAELAAAVLLLRLLSHRPWLAVAAVALLAGADPLAVASASGAPASLAFLFLVLACATHRSGGPLLTGAFCGLAACAAPEAALALPGIWLTRRAGARRLPMEALGFGLVLAVGVFTLWRLTGDWRPAPIVRTPDGVTDLGFTVWLLPVLAAVSLLARVDVPRAWAPIGFVGVLLLLPWIFLGDELGASAAYLPLAACLLPAAAGFERLATRRPWPALVALASVVTLGLVQLPREGAELRDDVWSPLATWSEEWGEAPPRLLTSAAGPVGWYTGANVLPMDPAALSGQLETFRPEYILISASRPELEALHADPRVAREWYPVKRFNASGETSLHPSAEALPAAATSDFLLFYRSL